MRTPIDGAARTTAPLREGRGRRARSTVLLFAAAFLAFGYNNVFMVLMPSYVVDAGWTLAEAGLQNSVFLIVAVALRFAAGPATDRWGARAAMLVGLGSFAVSGVLMGLPMTFPGLMAVRCGQAVGLATFWPAALAEVSELAPSGRRGLYVGAYRFVTSLSLMVGPAAAFFLVEQGGFGLCFATMAAVAALALLCVVGLGAPGAGAGHRERAKGPRTVREFGDPSRKLRPESLRERVRTNFGGSGALVAAVFGPTFGAAVGYGLLFSFSAIYLGSYGLQTLTGGFFTLVGLGALAANLVSGWLLDRPGHRGILPASLTLMGAALVMLAGVPWAAEVAGIAGVLAGLGYGAAITAAQAAIATQTAPDRRATALALQQNAIDIGIACASAGFGCAFAATSSANPVPFAAQGAILGTIAAILVLHNRRSQKGDLVP